MYTIITRNECIYCDNAKRFLELDNIPYVAYNIDDFSSGWVLTLLKEADITTVPQIFSTNGDLIGGFHELEAKLGYIKNLSA